MKLSAWMKKSGLKQSNLANQLATGKARAHRIFHGKIIPKPEEVIAIYHWSKGAVQPNDFYDLTQKINELPLFTGNGQAMPPGGGVVSVYSQGGP